jgi:hypothetical protein
MNIIVTVDHKTIKLDHSINYPVVVHSDKPFCYELVESEGSLWVVKTGRGSHIYTHAVEIDGCVWAYSNGWIYKIKKKAKPVVHHICRSINDFGTKVAELVGHDIIYSECRFSQEEIVEAMVYGNQLSYCSFLAMHIVVHREGDIFVHRNKNDLGKYICNIYYTSIFQTDDHNYALIDKRGITYIPNLNHIVYGSNIIFDCGTLCNRWGTTSDYQAVDLDLEYLDVPKLKVILSSRLPQRVMYDLVNQYYKKHLSILDI